MLYRVLKTFRGSPNGTSCVLYEEGTECALTESLAHEVLAAGWIEPVVKDAHKHVVQNDSGAAPENKMLESAQRGRTKHKRA